MSNVPPIATLRARASQIIVRLGYGQIKAALAATCAAKNAGTPISPTISGQNLINESQEIINQADSDALAIFLREFMELMYYGSSSGSTGYYNPANLTVLRSIPTASINKMAFLLGYNSASDGGGADLWWDDTAIDDDEPLLFVRPDDFDITRGGGWRQR